MDTNSERFLTEAEAARVLRISTRTLQRRRRDGAGPLFVKLGARVLYRVGDLSRWTLANTYGRKDVRDGR